MEEGLAKILESAAADAAVKPVLEGTDGLEIVCRKADGCSFYFIINFGDEAKQVPSALVGHMEMLTEETVKPGDMLAKYDVKIVRVE